MSSYLDVVSGEIATIQHLLESLPFDRTEGHSQTKSPYFLDVYRVHRPEMQLLNDVDGKFPLDASKLLKLGISLGNLLKSLQQDEEMFAEQQRKQQQLNKSLGVQQQQQQQQQQKLLPQPPSGAKTQQLQPSPQLHQYDVNNPFIERKLLAPSHPPPPPPGGSSATVNSSSLVPTLPPPIQIRFVQNLLKVLKNYDIGSTVQDNVNRPPHLSTASSTSTLSQHMQNSPIKLSSKQLLIEKLEINIELDNLFTYKIVLKLLMKIYEIIEKQLQISGTGAGTPTNFGGNNNSNITINGPSSPGRNMSSSSSIFSTTSYSSTDSSMSMDDYLLLLKQIVNRVSVGIIEPFVQVIVTNVAEKGIIDRFGELLKSLD